MVVVNEWIGGMYFLMFPADVQNGSASKFKFLLPSFVRPIALRLKQLDPVKYHPHPDREIVQLQYPPGLHH
jgi:hypothetical protein